MKILALDGSNALISLALAEDGRVVAESAFDASARRALDLFAETEGLLSRAGWQLADLDGFAAGRGPGSYTGLRVTLTAARAWALPRNLPVVAVSSPAAVACAHFEANPAFAGELVVSGDARRGTEWAARFARDEATLVRQTGEERLLTAEEKASVWQDATWLPRDLMPPAAAVAKLFFAGYPAEEPVPRYMHPAVAVPAAV